MFITSKQSYIRDFAEEVKRTSDAIKILDNRLNELLDEYNAAAALLEDEEND